MDTIVWVVLAIALAILVAAVAIVLLAGRSRKRDGDMLRRDFGPEYDHAVGEYGSEREAQSALKSRKDRVERLNLRPVSAADRSRFSSSWESTQAHFVDEPSAAVADAQRLIDDAMKARGFPVGDFDQRAADISVEHPYVVENYRAAHDIAEKNASGDADTEQLRQAMVHYRSLFDELINTTAPEPAALQDTPAERGDPGRVDIRRGATKGR